MTKTRSRFVSTLRARQVVGIDASRALTYAPTGTEYYSRALIQALLQTESPFRFRLYTRTNPPPDLFPLSSEIRVIPFPRLWTHFRLSCEMLTRPPGALFVPAHVLPPIHPRNSLVTVHDLGYKFFPDAHPPLQRMYLDLSTRWNVRAASVVIADSFATRDDILRFYGTPSKKIRVVYPSYNADVFGQERTVDNVARVRAKYGLTSPYVLSVGTIQPRKNYARLIEASAALPSEYSLVIVGKKGWLFDSIFTRTRELGMEARVRFLDYVPTQDLPSLYAGARLAVLPSLYEGFGFPALEAQATETPLVCANSSSLPEVAGEGALYFDPRQVSEIARAMELGLRDEAVRRALVEHGRENVKRFSWERAAREIVEIVKSP